MTFCSCTETKGPANIFFAFFGERRESRRIYGVNSFSSGRSCGLTFCLQQSSEQIGPARKYFTKKRRLRNSPNHVSDPDVQALVPADRRKLVWEDPRVSRTHHGSRRAANRGWCWHIFLPVPHGLGDQHKSTNSPCMCSAGITEIERTARHPAQVGAPRGEKQTDLRR